MFYTDGGNKGTRSLGSTAKNLPAAVIAYVLGDIKGHIHGQDLNWSRGTTFSLVFLMSLMTSTIFFIMISLKGEASRVLFFFLT